MRTHGYDYIVQWGNLLGSSAAFIQDECDRAQADRAPKHATYRNDDGSWATTDDVTNTSTRRILGLEPLPPSDERVIAHYDGEIVGKEPATGLDNFLYRIRFDSVPAAAVWARAHRISDQVTLNGFLRFDQPVTVEYLPDQ